MSKVGSKQCHQAASHVQMSTALEWCCRMEAPIKQAGNDTYSLQQINDVQLSVVLRCRLCSSCFKSVPCKMLRQVNRDTVNILHMTFVYRNNVTRMSHGIHTEPIVIVIGACQGFALSDILYLRMFPVSITECFSFHSLPCHVLFHYYVYR